MRPGRTLGTATDRDRHRNRYGPARGGGPRARSSPYRLRWTSLYRSDRGRLRTAAAAPHRSRTAARERPRETAARRPRGRPRDTAEKSRRVCRHNGLFAAIPTVAENRDGIGQAVGSAGAVRRCRCIGVALVTQMGEIVRRLAMPVRTVLAPVHRLRRRPRPRASAQARRMTRCTPLAEAPALAGARGPLAGRCAAMSYVSPGHSPRSSASPAKESACRHTPGARP